MLIHLNQPIYSIDDLKYNYERTSQGHWFEKSGMKFFRTKLTSHFRKVNDYTFLFVTTEQFVSSRGESSPRMATLRLCTIEIDKSRHCGYKMNIETIGDFNSMSISQAKTKMKQWGL